MPIFLFEPPAGYAPSEIPKAKQRLWIEGMEGRGADVVRQALAHGSIGGDPGASVKTLYFPRIALEDPDKYPPRWFVEAWLANESRKAGRRAELHHWLLILATVAAVIGAITGIWATCCA